MAFDLESRLVIGVSSRALFDLSKENELFEREGVEAYCSYQVEHEQELLKPGPGFALVKALLNINRIPGQEGQVEVIVMSRNSPDTSLRVFHAIKEYGLDITRAVLVSGASLAPYLTAFQTDLFLSAYEEDVQGAIDSGIAAGIICSDGIHTYNCDGDIRQIRIAFDGDAVLFSDESERIYQEQGLEAFEKNEQENAKNPLQAGPFARFFKDALGSAEGISAGGGADQNGPCDSQKRACPRAGDPYVKGLGRQDRRSFFSGRRTETRYFEGFRGAHFL